MLPRLVFLYGTLLQGACNPVAVALHRQLAPGQPGRVRARLFALPDPAGWYPALLPGEGEVLGTVHPTLPGFDAALLAKLDDYEDVRSDGAGEYRREAIAVTTERGELTAEAWVYNVPLPSGAQEVADGDFPGFLRRHGLAAFG